MNWLKEGLKSSDAAFKIIMNSVPITAFPYFSGKDTWIGYPAQRDELLKFIDHYNIPGILWISGDLHFASVGKVSKEGPGSTQQEILAGPGAQIPDYLCLPLNMNSQFEWVSARNNYITVHFDPHKMDVELVYQGGAEDPEETQFDKIAEIYRTKFNLGKK